MKPFRSLLTIVALVALVVTAAGNTWVVRSGDTLWGIARTTGTTVAELAAANGITTPDLIRPGQSLRLPGAGAHATDQPTDDASSASGDGSTQDAPQPGETPDDGADIDVPPDDVSTHRIRPGDTLFGIARAHGTSVSELVRLNGIDDRNLIRVGERLILRAAADDPPSSSTDQPAATRRLTPAQIGDLIESTARRQSVDPALAKAVAWQESRWRNHVVSSSGARGVMQMMPATGRWVSASLAGRTLDLDDPGDNVLGGVLYLRYLGDTTGDERRLLASYFQGPNAVARHGISPAGQRYVEQVLAHRERFR